MNRMQSSELRHRKREIAITPCVMKITDTKKYHGVARLIEKITTNDEFSKFINPSYEAQSNAASLRQTSGVLMQIRRNDVCFFIILAVLSGRPRNWDCSWESTPLSWDSHDDWTPFPCNVRSGSFCQHLKIILMNRDSNESCTVVALS